MKRRTYILAFLAGVCFAGRASCELNYVDEVFKLTNEQDRVSFVRSLDEKSVWAMANQAYAKGWSDYAVGAGIVELYFGDRWAETPPSESQLAAIITSTNFHCRLRANMAASGLKYARQWKAEDALRFVDVVLSILDDQAINDGAKTAIPERLMWYLKSKIMSCPAEGAIPSDREQVHELHLRTIRVIDLLASMIAGAAGKSEGRDRPISYAVTALTDYLTWYPSASSSVPEICTQSRRATHNARETLAQVLTNTNYIADVARVVLRRAGEIHLNAVLPHSAVETLKHDPRFSDDECQGLLEGLQRSESLDPVVPHGEKALSQ